MRATPLLTASLCLLAQGLRAQAIRGNVLEEETGQPVASGTVTLVDRFGNDVARAPTQGHFLFTAPVAGRYGLRFQALGYQTTYSPPLNLTPPDTLTVTLRIRRTTVTLDTVQVTAQPATGRLAEFNLRRQSGLGSFMTRQEFEAFPTTRVTDVLRRLRGITIVRNPRYLTGGDTRQFLVFNSRVGGQCAPVVFVDGTSVGSAATFDFDAVVPIDDLEAIEAYSGSNAPVRFAAGAAGCGVIAVWTRPATAATVSASSSHLDLGGQAGVQLTTSAPHARVGAQLALGLSEVVELYSMLNTTGDGPQVVAALRLRILGEGSPWYLGAGLSSATAVGETHHLFLGGFTLQSKVVRPFVEIQVLSPFTPSRTEAHVFTGIRLRAW